MAGASSLVAREAESEKKEELDGEEAGAAGAASDAEAAVAEDEWEEDEEQWDAAEDEAEMTEDEEEEAEENTVDAGAAAAGLRHGAPEEASEASDDDEWHADAEPAPTLAAKTRGGAHNSASNGATRGAFNSGAGNGASRAGPSKVVNGVAKATAGSNSSAAYAGVVLSRDTIAKLQAENRTLRVELGQERFKVQQLAHMREKMAEAQRKELNAKRSEKEALRQLQDAKNYVARRANFESSERADLLQQIASLERLLKETTDREGSMQQELSEALSEKAGADFHISEAKKETELWRRDTILLQTKLKNAEQRMEQMQMQRKATETVKQVKRGAIKQAEPVMRAAVAPREPSENSILAWCPWLRQPRRQSGRAGHASGASVSRSRSRDADDDLKVVVKALDKHSQTHRERVVFAVMAMLICGLAVAKAAGGA